MRVLIVEDEPRMARVLDRGFTQEGIAVDLAATGRDALWMAAATRYTAIILDVMLPDLDGFAVCRRLRSEKNWTPILMLTARDAVQDRVAGLDVGADDYVLKPFAFDELLARMRALVRRGAPARPAILKVGSLRLDPADRTVRRGATPIALSPKELAVLDDLMRHAGEVRTRGELLEAVWDHAYENRSNVVDVYVRNLRKKIDLPFGLATLETVRGHGYRLCPED